MNCPNPLGNVIVAMMKMTMAGYMKRLWIEITQAENAATQQLFSLDWYRANGTTDILTTLASF